MTRHISSRRKLIPKKLLPMEMEQLRRHKQDHIKQRTFQTRPDLDDHMNLMEARMEQGFSFIASHKYAIDVQKGK
jgi:tRNA G37 N-methylase TrmD